MLLGERGVSTEASLFRTRPNHVHTYFIKCPVAEYATPKPDGNLTRLSPRESLARETSGANGTHIIQQAVRSSKSNWFAKFFLRHFSAITTFPGPAVSRIRMKLAVKDSLHLFSPMKDVDFRYLV